MNASPNTLCRDILDHWKITTSGNHHLCQHGHCHIAQRLVDGTRYEVMSSEACQESKPAASTVALG